MIVGVTGHMRIPWTARGWVKRAVLKTLKPSRKGLVGLSALAPGADQIFAECILRLNGDLVAIIPSDGYEETFPREKDRKAYQKLISRAKETRFLNYEVPDEDAYCAAGRAVVDNCDLLIAVWDGEPARGRGGAGDIVDYARERGVLVTVLWPNCARRK